MIEVEQRHMAAFDEHGDNLQRGDCLSACVASLFEVPLDDVPFFVESDRWYEEYHGWARERGFQIGHVRISVDEDDPARLTGYPADSIYWIATVKSPRGKARCHVCKGAREAAHQWIGDEERYVEYDTPQPCVECGATGLVPTLHCIVMRGAEIVWDPHPKREMGHLGFVSGEWFVAIDPSRLTLRAPAAS